MMKQAKKAPGRPARHSGEKLSKNRTFRVRGQLDDQLAVAAERSGRSVSEEIEYRLDRSFENQLALEQALNLAFGSAISGHLMIVGDIMRTTAQAASLAVKGDPSLVDWRDDPEIFDQVAKAVAAFFEECSPRAGMDSGSTPSAPALPQDFAEGIAVKRAAELMRSRSSTKGRE